MKITKKYLQKVIQEEIQNTLKEFRWPWEDEPKSPVEDDDFDFEDIDGPAKWKSPDEKEAFRQSMLRGTSMDLDRTAGKEFGPDLDWREISRLLDAPAAEFEAAFQEASKKYAESLGGTADQGLRGYFAGVRHKDMEWMRSQHLKPHFAKQVEKYVFPSQGRAGGKTHRTKAHLKDLERSLKQRSAPKLWVFNKMFEREPGAREEAQQRARELGAPENVLKAVLAGEGGVVKTWALK